MIESYWLDCSMDLVFPLALDSVVALFPLFRRFLDTKMFDS